jgi:hypothetical protein
MLSSLSSLTKRLERPAGQPEHAGVDCVIACFPVDRVRAIPTVMEYRRRQEAQLAGRAVASQTPSAIPAPVAGMPR